MNKIRLYVLRHATVTDTRKIYGISDLPILDFQIEDKDRIRALLTHPLQLISSPLQRTINTLEKFCVALSIASEINTDERLLEQNFGLLELTDFGEDAEVIRPYWHFPADFRPPDGESFEDLARRVSDFLNEKISEKTNANLLICTHGGVIRAMLAHILETQLDNCSIFDISPLSLTILEYSANKHGKMLWWIKAVGIKLN